MLAEARSYLALPFPIISDVSTYNFIIYSIVNQRSKRGQRLFRNIKELYSLPGHTSSVENTRGIHTSETV